MSTQVVFKLLWVPYEDQESKLEAKRLHAGPPQPPNCINMLLISVFSALVSLLDHSAASVISETPNVNLDPPSSGNEYIVDLKFPSSRIINGFYVSHTSFKIPWIVVLFQYNEPFCTGSLINDQYILTAAHCVAKRLREDCRAPIEKRNLNFQAVIGENDFNNARHNSNKIHQVISFWIHNKYKGGHCNKWNFDFAVLKLQKPVSNTPVCLHSGASKSTGRISAVGYGQTNLQRGTHMSSLLKGVNVRNVPLPECSRRWNYTMASSKLCTEGAQRYAGTCNGDSGGPLVLYDESFGFIQIGVTSYGSADQQQSCNKGRPDVYSRVSSGLLFIRSKAGSIKTC